MWQGPLGAGILRPRAHSVSHYLCSPLDRGEEAFARRACGQQAGISRRGCSHPGPPSLPPARLSRMGPGRLPARIQGGKGMCCGYQSCYHRSWASWSGHLVYSSQGEGCSRGAAGTENVPGPSLECRGPILAFEEGTSESISQRPRRCTKAHL